MKLKRLTLCGILTAIALSIFVLESYLPPLVPIPGVKLGLANLVTLFALLVLAPHEALLILLARILLGAFLIGNPAVLLYSLCGGLCCFGVELLLLKCLPSTPAWALGMVGALVHNFAQIALAAIVTHTAQVFWYLPPLIVSGLITGLFTGLCVYFLQKKCAPHLQRFLQSENKG